MTPPPGTIFSLSKKGDLPGVKIFVEKEKVDVNARDRWDGTALYYACYCGHYDIVQYLLQNGARCDPRTFDAERCILGALTMDIRKLLQSYNIVMNSSENKKGDDLETFCERMMAAKEFSDITLRSRNKQRRLHRCILSCRSSYLAENIISDPNSLEDLHADHGITPEVFLQLVNYIYIGKITSDLSSDEIAALSKVCTVKNLPEILKKVENARNSGPSQPSVDPNQKPAPAIITITPFHINTRLSRKDLISHFGSLIDQGLPHELVRDRRSDSVGNQGEHFFDTCLLVEGHRFYCHKVFVCTRSDYFRALLDNHFSENSLENGMSVVTIHNVKPQVMACVLYYIYTNSSYKLNKSIVLDVLETANVYLLPGLKRQCAQYLCSLPMDEGSYMTYLHISRIHDLEKLEDVCAQFIAKHIAKAVKDEEFCEFVLADAHSVQRREETDSIPIIDDIRFHIEESGDKADKHDVRNKLKIIDELLEELGLDA